MTTGRVLGGAGLVLALAGAAAGQGGGPVTMGPVSYADLGKVVRANRGKVVVVDFWTFT